MKQQPKPELKHNTPPPEEADTLQDISDEPLSYHELHRMLSQDARAMRLGRITVQRANATCNVMGKFTNMIKLQLEMYKLVGQKPLELFQQLQMPAPTTKLLRGMK